MTKDWTGNKSSSYRILGASNHSSGEREQHDFYATDPTAIDDLLKYETFNKNIWECACGQGHLAERLKQQGFNVKCTDLIDRDYGTGGVDFLKNTEKFYGDVITNPPYKYTSEFILKALESVPDGAKVAMFLKLQTLEGANRYREIYSKFPPQKVYVYSKRKKCFMNGIDDGKSSAICYAWFVWVKGEYDRTEIKWIY